MSNPERQSKQNKYSVGRNCNERDGIDLHGGRRWKRRTKKTAGREGKKRVCEKEKQQQKNKNEIRITRGQTRKEGGKKRESEGEKEKKKK